MGRVGLIVLIIFITPGYLLARGARRRSSDPRERDLSLVISGSILGLVVSYFTFDAWAYPMVAGLTFLLIGMAGAASRASRWEPQTRPAVWQSPSGPSSVRRHDNEHVTCGRRRDV